MKLAWRGRPIEHRWALNTLRELRIPQTRQVDDLVEFFAQRLGRPIRVVPTDEPVTNGALEDWAGGALAIRVNAAANPARRQRLICRGLARALYREPGARDGQQDHTTSIEREIEFAAGYLNLHLDECASRDPIGDALALNPRLRLAPRR